MKGHTKIELTNTKTGEVQTFEEHNIVTNWMRDANQIQFPWVCDSFKHAKDLTITGYSTEDTNSARTPFTDFGGVLLFTEQLEENPDNYYPTGTVTMVGHASSDTYSGVDLTRGSFNDNLSSYNLEKHVATMVWDFGLEQGNGTIGTVCLCNHVDGKIGYGSKYYAEDTNLGKAPFYHHAGIGGLSMSFTLRYRVDASETRQCAYYAGFFPVYIDRDSNKAIFMMNCLANNNFVFAVADIDASSVLLLDYNYRSGNTLYHSRSSKRTQYFEVPVNVSYTTANNYTSLGSDQYFIPFNRLMMFAGLDYQGNFWFSRDAYVYTASSNSSDLSRCFNWTSGTAKTFVKVNLKTLETTEYEVTNTAGTIFRANQGYATNYFGYLADLCVVNNYMFIKDINGNLYAINLNNNADVHRVKLGDESEADVTLYCATGTYPESNATVYYANGNRRGWVVDVLGDKIIFNRYGGLTYWHYDGTVHVDGVMYILDTNTFTAKPLCAPAKPCCMPNPSTGSTTSVPQNRNSGRHHLPCLTDSPVRFAFELFAQTGSYNTETDFSASYVWDASNKYVDSSVVVSGYGYRPMGLLTINRLSEPVTKTADMTMRITYTLTA